MNHSKWKVTLTTSRTYNYPSEILYERFDIPYMIYYFNLYQYSSIIFFVIQFFYI